MNFRVYTGRAEQILKIGIRTTTGKPEKICIVVCDAEQSNTVFTNRYKVFEGDQYFYVRLPVSPKTAIVQIYNDAIGNRPQKQETTFVMIDESGRIDKVNDGIYKMPLEKKMDVVDMAREGVRSFVRFAQGFCYYMGVMQAGNYKSTDGQIQINLLPVIMRGDKESSTPARISEDTKIIEVSQKIMMPFTVPMRFAILCHEFSHCYMNAKPEDETEADLQGLLIYLGLGFPRIEAHQVFTQTFIGAQNKVDDRTRLLNEKRYRILKRFIEDFENNKMLFNE